MALFSNESEKNNHPEHSTKPQTAPVHAAPTAPVMDHSVAPAALAGSPAHLDRGTKVNGKLRFEGPARIDGYIEGEIKGKDITIGESGVVTAQITAESVVVCGKVDGEIIASKRIEIRPTAKVAGNVTTPMLVIQEGAHFEGHSAMAMEHEDRKVPANRNGAPADSRATAS